MPRLLRKNRREEDGIFEWQTRAVATRPQHLCPASGWKPAPARTQVSSPVKEQPPTRLMHGRRAGLVACTPPTRACCWPAPASRRQSLLGRRIHGVRRHDGQQQGVSSAFRWSPALRAAATWWIPGGGTRRLPHAPQLIRSPSQKNAGGKGAKQIPK